MQSVGYLFGYFRELKPAMRAINIIDFYCSHVLRFYFVNVFFNFLKKFIENSIKKFEKHF